MSAAARPVALHARDLGGDGPPLLILHGLFGAAQNWGAAGRALAARFHVVAVDLRNHGGSPHTAPPAPGTTVWEEMSADLLHVANDRGWRRFSLIGHSLGGKAAMRFALDHPQRLERLCVVDIAPMAYPGDSPELAAMCALAVDDLVDRADADARLARLLPAADAAARGFLLSNLVRQSAGWFRWRLNLQTLHAVQGALRGNPLRADEVSPLAALCIVGGRSPYVDDAGRAALARHFPHCRLVALPESGHNPHIDNRDALVRTLIEGWAAAPRQHGPTSNENRYFSTTA